MSHDLAEPRCFTRSCKWLGDGEGLDDSEDNERVVCPAFPNGIPDRIAYGDDPHLTVAPDQVGEFVYEEQQDQQE